MSLQSSNHEVPLEAPPQRRSDPETKPPEDRWEYGSDFHFISEHGISHFPWEGKPHLLFASGRDALRALVAWGKSQGWNRIFAPSFYCEDVTDALERDAVNVTRYWDDPLAPTPLCPPDAKAPDGVVVVNYYGLRPSLSLSTPGLVIEDHSHDLVGPAAWKSRARFAIASLRKTLPLPDGGVLWSPVGERLPPSPSPSPTHVQVALQRLSAMVLKAIYLAGGTVAKDSFRTLATAGEQGFSTGPISRISALSEALLPSFPTVEWSKRRARNFRIIVKTLADASGFRVLLPSETRTPFAATLLFEDPNVRERTRRALIASRVYPAVLWPIRRSETSERACALSDRLLTVHCDFRYSEDDMLRVGAIVRRCIQEALNS